MRTRFKYWWISILVILLDQATKLRIRHTMELFDSISVWGDFFRITYVTNYGGAFSISTGNMILNRLIFTIATIIAMGLVLFLITKTEKVAHLIAYFLVLGGGIGNLIDRVAYGYVVDFLDFDFFDVIIRRWPVFNVADSAITIAVIILLVDMIFFSKHSESTKKQLTETEAADG